VSSEVDDQKVAFDALQAGALEVLPKPRVSETGGFEKYRTELVSTLRAMAGVQVLRRRRGGSGLYLRPSPPPDLPPVEPLARASAPSIVPGVRVVQLGRRYRFVAIGASTGGPQVIAQLLSGLPPSLAFPIALVQHMSPGFTPGFARWLQGETKLKVKLAEEGEAPAAGVVYVAPDRYHLRLGRDWLFHLSSDVEGLAFCPAVDVLFQSVAVSAGRSGIGLLLTGMGTDGAQGLVELRRAGGWTLAQEGHSCVVNGMPNAAAQLGGVSDFVSPSMIPSLLKEASELR
jgi:two-component system, chemotaxis family, protein-glutamate methylesterase/glutaminase